MEKDSIKENEIKSEVEETEVQTSNIETTEAETNAKNQDIKEENNENSFMQVILANILDQVLLVAVSAVLVLLCSVVMKLFGYMFVEGTGAIVIAAGIIYFILNCIYVPIIEKTKMKNTIAKKILNIK